mmetsp:Transcript_23270/g.34159  ORF Transcript_23270/g.34159 Transcript_23270/m.34159 type:complete len:205 (-) Transcript_23270:200-814(-)
MLSCARFSSFLRLSNSCSSEVTSCFFCNMPASIVSSSASNSFTTLSALSSSVLTELSSLASPIRSLFLPLPPASSRSRSPPSATNDDSSSARRLWRLSLRSARSRSRVLESRNTSASALSISLCKVCALSDRVCSSLLSTAVRETLRSVCISAMYSSTCFRAVLISASNVLSAALRFSKLEEVISCCRARAASSLAICDVLDLR